MENNVSLDLMEFIEQKILPRYTEFDKAHNLAHANSVIRRSLEIARRRSGSQHGLRHCRLS